MGVSAAEIGGGEEGWIEGVVEADHGRLVELAVDLERAATEAAVACNTEIRRGHHRDHAGADGVAGIAGDLEHVAEIRTTARVGDHNVAGETGVVRAGNDQSAHVAESGAGAALVEDAGAGERTGDLDVARAVGVRQDVRPSALHSSGACGFQNVGVGSGESQGGRAEVQIANLHLIAGVRTVVVHVDGGVATDVDGDAAGGLIADDDGAVVVAAVHADLESAAVEIEGSGRGTAVTTQVVGIADLQGAAVDFRAASEAVVAGFGEEVGEVAQDRGAGAAHADKLHGASNLTEEGRIRLSGTAIEGEAGPGRTRHTTTSDVGGAVANAVKVNVLVVEVQHALVGEEKVRDTIGQSTTGGKAKRAGLHEKSVDDVIFSGERELAVPKFGQRLRHDPAADRRTLRRRHINQTFT